MPELRQVVIIMTDSQGTNIVGCYGRPEMSTPHLDRLAAEGARFDRAYTTSPVCGPARSALFTGTYPHTNGSWGNNLPIGLNVKTVGQRLSDEGLKTGHIGKWHLDATDYFGSGRCPEGWDPAYWFDMRNYLDRMSPEDRLFSRQVHTAEELHARGVTAEFTFAHQCADRARELSGPAREGGLPPRGFLRRAAPSIRVSALLRGDVRGVRLRAGRECFRSHERQTFASTGMGRGDTAAVGKAVRAISARTSAATPSWIRRSAACWTPWTPMRPRRS